MKIAINAEVKNLKGKEQELKRAGYEVCSYFPEFIFDITEYTKKNGINVYVGLPTDMRNKIKDSLSISTSTYMIDDSENLIDRVNEISKNRKPSEEKIWNRYYNDEQLASSFPQMTKNDFIRNKNIDPNLTALEYFGKKISYSEYDKRIIEYSKKLETLGVKPGDSVALCLPNTIETMLLVAAMDENAIICNNIFPLESAEKIKYCINMMGSKLAFVLDSRYKDLDKIASQTTLTDAYLVSPFESLPAMKRIISIKEKLNGNNPKESDFKLFSDFEKVKGTEFKKAKYEKDRLSSIQYTSGTMGEPKATLLTDDTLNARAHQYEHIDVGLKPKARFIQAIPICGKAFGEFTMHLGLANGMENVLLPTFESKKLLQIIEKNKGQGISLPPISWYDVVDSPKFKKSDMSDYRLISIGAEGMHEKNIRMVEDKFKAQGFKNRAILGAGGTELGVSFSTNTNEFNELGTSGFPLKGNNVKIVDENGNELPYNHKGRVIYSVVSPCLGYANKNIELKKDEFGIDLGDYGFINERGNLTVLGRVSDLIEINGVKIAPAEIEEFVLECPYVKYAYVVKPKNSESKVRVCYITYDDVECENIDEVVMGYVPEEYRYTTEIFRLDHVPIAPSLKTDRKHLSGDISDLMYTQSVKALKKKKKHDK